MGFSFGATVALAYAALFPAQQHAASRSPDGQSARTQGLTQPMRWSAHFPPRHRQLTRPRVTPVPGNRLLRP